MSAAEALEVAEVARAAGISVEIDGDDLVLEASAPPQPALLDLMSHHKASIMALLRLADDGWSAEDWQVFFDERAGIAEFDGGLATAAAETASWQRTQRIADQAHDPVLRNGVVESTGHAWLHARCWPAWYAGKKAEAVAALEVIGIAVPELAN